MLSFYWCFNRTVTEKRPAASTQLVFGRYPCSPGDAVLCPVAGDTGRDAPSRALDVSHTHTLNPKPTAADSFATGPPSPLAIEVQVKLSWIKFGVNHGK